MHTVSVVRLAAAGALLLTIPLIAGWPALAELGVVAFVVAGAVLIESVIFAESRRKSGPSWLRTDRSAEGVLAGQGLTDHQLVHLRGALVGQHRLQVVGMAQHRILQRDAVGAEDGPAFAGDS